MARRLLPPQLQEKAELELNEVPKRVEDDIADVKKWLNKQPHLTARMDDQWILSFLRGCKFSLERTKNKLTQYYTMRTVASDFFINRDPFLPEMQQLLKKGICIPLNKSPDPAAPRVLLLRSGNDCDKPLLVINMIKVTLMILDILINEDDNFVIAGHVVLQDFKGVILDHAVQLTPAIVKNMMTCLQHAYPTRPKEFHFVNTPTFFQTLFSMVKPFLTTKLRKRIIIYNNNNVDDIFRTIPKSILPTEYGGQGGPINILIDHWKTKVETYREWFLKDTQYSCSNEINRNPHMLKTEFGFEGSFRKLAVD